MASNVSVSIGMTGKEFVGKNNLGDSMRVDRQPAGINFYEYDWPLDDRGKIIFNHGKYGFEIDDSLSIVCPEDVDSKEEGFTNISVTFGFAGGGDVPHDLVRKEFLSFLDHLKSLGWRRVIYYDDPRLSGEDAYNYFLEDPVYSFPLDYKMSLTEWMSLDDIPVWTLHADGVFLEIGFHRDKSKMDPDKPGSYLFTMSIDKKEEYGRSFFSAEDRDRWEKLWVELIMDLKKNRFMKEDALRKKGVDIDSSYEDPLVHSEDPVEIE